MSATPSRASSVPLCSRTMSTASLLLLALLLHPSLAAPSCLPNGQTCQWDTSMGDCCSTYCYQQVGQSTGVCQDRPASTLAGQSYQTPQRSPATYAQSGYSGAQTGTASGQCLPNGQTCQWDTSLGNCCSTYCYQQVGQTLGVCQDRPSGSLTSQPSQPYQTPQRNPATYTQTGQSYYGSPVAQTGTASGQCLPNGQTCQWDTSMGDCCSTYCYQQAGQSTGVCKDRPASSTNLVYQTQGNYQPVQQNPASYTGAQSACNPCAQAQQAQYQPTNTQPAQYQPQQSYATPTQSGAQTGCLQNGQSCTWSGSTGNCCSGWCRQLESQATGTCAQPAGTPGAYTQQTQASQQAPTQNQIYYQQSQSSYSQQGYSTQGASQSACLNDGAACTWSGSTGNCCSGWCKQMENQATGACSQPMRSQG